MDRLRALSLLIAIADAGGFARGGAKLGLSPPATSRVVADLEAELGVALFRRSTRRVHLTEAGERLVADGRAALASVEAAFSTAAGAAVEPKGHLAITAPVTFGRLILADIVAAFLAAHPDVTASLLLLDRVVDLIDEGQDVALRIGTGGAGDARALGLGTAQRIAVASPGYVARHGPITDPDRHRRVAFFADDRGLARLTVNDAATAVRLAEAGEGVVWVLSYQAAAAIAAGRLVAVARAPERLPVRLVYPPERRLSAKLTAFLRFAAPRLREQLRSTLDPIG